MKIIYITNVKFGAGPLTVLLANKANVVGVITSKDNLYNNADFFCADNVLGTYSGAIHYTQDINSTATAEWIRSLAPDVIVCIGWSRLINLNILNIPTYGCIGYHPSLLPKNAGRHPIIWPIVLGLSFTGSTFFRMEEGADSGPVIAQSRVRISKTLNAGDLYEKLGKVAEKQVVKILANQSLIKNMKNFHAKSIRNTWRKRSRIDGNIDWRMSARTIFNLYRGLFSPYPGVEFSHQGVTYRVNKLSKSRLAPKWNEPGKVIRVSSKGATVKCGQGAIMLIETIPKLETSVGEYLGR
jgi:methionyl-tRNA formyltransferase